MPQLVFPDCALFTWGFCLVLLTITVIAAFTDLRSMTIPKTLTVPGLFLGIGANIFREALLGAADERGPWVGAAGGLFFAATGFVVAFGLFFVLWVLGTCHGGDVKLFGALGAWVGPWLAIVLLLLTIVVVAVTVLLRAVLRLVRGKPPTVTGGPSTGSTRREQTEARRLRQRLVYSPSLVLAVGLLLLWVLRTELHLVP